MLEKYAYCTPHVLNWHIVLFIFTLHLMCLLSITTKTFDYLKGFLPLSHPSVLKNVFLTRKKREIIRVHFDNYEIMIFKTQFAVRLI